MRRAVLALFVSLAFIGSAFAFAGFAPYDKAKFDSLVQSGAPVIAHVHASWCSTCKRQETLMDEMLKDPRYAKVNAVRVDYDRETAFEKAHDVKSRATILVFKGGKEVSRLVFDTDPAHIRKTIDAAL